MAADLGISRIYSTGKLIWMSTSMTKKVFKLMVDSMSSDVYRNSLVFMDKEIKVSSNFNLLISEYVL